MSKFSKYSLPRHTVLAKQSSRFGAAIVDMAITLLFFIGLFYGCFNLIFSNCIANAQFSQLRTWELHSHLIYFNEDTQQTSIYESTEDYTVYQTPVKYYYLNYLTGLDIEIPSGGDISNPKKYASPLCDQEMSLEDGSKVLPKDYYNIEWFNTNILGINVEDPDGDKSATYFTYVKDGEGHYQKDVLGIPRDHRYDSTNSKTVDITKTDLATYFKSQYISAYYHLTDLSFYSDMSTQVNFYTGLSAMIPLILSGAISYVIVPLFFSKGETFGKKIFKIGLANMQGYKFKKPQLLLRFIPYLLTTGCVFLITSSSIYICIIIVAVMLLASFGVMMASPKKCALHDYTAQTIVIDTKESIIFENEILEDEYIAKEDKIDEEIVMGGEEPELRYEK